MEKKSMNLKKWMFLISFTLIGYWIVNNLSIVGNFFDTVFNILFPFILGACLAFILNIPMSFFEKKLKKIKSKKLLRILSMIFAIIIILLVIILTITLIIPRLIDIVQILIDNIPYYTERINGLIDKYEINIPDINSIDIENIKNQITDKIPGIITSSISLVSNIVGGVSNFFIAVVFAVYILIDKEKLQMQTIKLLRAYLSEKRANKIINIGKVTNSVFRKFFTVQCLEATILGTLCMIGMLILKIPYAATIGILVGVTALIPIVGAFIGIIVGAILIASVNPIKVVTFVIFVLILQQIEGNFIYPRVVGTSLGLPGMWVLFAVSIGGSIGGILGMLLGVPIATTIYTILKDDVNKKIKYKTNKEKL